MKRFFALNEAAKLFGWAANELTLDGEWLKISPWGEFDNKVGRQNVQREDGEAMVAAFNSLKGRASRLFRGLPIYVGHPDFEPDRYQDKRRYGRINDLEARENGLYGQVAFNSLGKQVVDDGQYLYVSPAWYLRRDGRHVRPTELVSVGFTNNPQIPGEPWAQNEPPEKGTAMKKSIVVSLVSAGLIKPEATEAEQDAAVEQLIAKNSRESQQQQQQQQQATNESEKLKTDLQTANDKLKTEREARIQRELDIAVNAGVIMEADRAAWNDRLNANFEDGVKELGERKPAINTQSKVGALGARKQEQQASQSKISAINEEVRKYAKEYGIDVSTNDGWNRAFAGVQRTKPALFEPAAKS